MIKFFKHPMRLLRLLVAPLLFLAVGSKGQVPEVYSGSVVNIGYVSHGNALSGSSFYLFEGSSYNSLNYGAGGIDDFIGAVGNDRPPEISGGGSPIFNFVNFNVGTNYNKFNINNWAGLNISGVVNLGKGILNTRRATLGEGLLGSLRFLESGVYTPVLTPAIGPDPVFVEGFVSKMHPIGFVFPVGNVTDLRTITATGMGTIFTEWNNTNIASSYPYTNATMPVGTTAINTNGYWEWMGSSDAAVIVSIPDVSGLTTKPEEVSIVGFDGFVWSNLGGTFTSNLENSKNTTAITVPVGTQALAIGLSVPYVLVSPMALLQGAINGSVMTKSLNALNLIPLSQPYNNSTFNYTGTEVLTSLPENMTDWILVDLRDSITPALIVATKAALLMNDGTITDLDGVSPVAFLNIKAGHYFIGLRHRNHFGIRNAALLALSKTNTIYDFRTTKASAYNNPGITTNAAMVNVGANFAMWAGNNTGKNIVRYGGPGNTMLPLLTGFLNGNSGTVVQNVYSPFDTNMDGKVDMPGTGTDGNFLLNSVLGGDRTKVITQHL